MSLVQLLGVLSVAWRSPMKHGGAWSRALFDQSESSGGDKVVEWEGLSVSSDSKVGAGTLCFWLG